MLAIAHSRATLAGIELAEERERLVRRMLLAVLGILALGLSAAVFTLLMVVIFWDTWRVQVLVIFLCLYAALAVWCMARMRAEAAQAPILLERTLTELEHDTAAFTSPVVACSARPSNAQARVRPCAASIAAPARSTARARRPALRGSGAGPGSVAKSG